MERKPIQTGAIIGLILLIVLELIRIFISPLSINVYVIGYIICLFIGSVIAGTKTINKENAWKSGVWVGIVMAIINPFLNSLMGGYSFVFIGALIMVVINTLVWSLIFGSIGGYIGSKLSTL